jgi:adenylate kinase family enzyme
VAPSSRRSRTLGRALSSVGTGHLTCDDRAVRRVSVVGNSGSGKTSLARRLSAALDLEHIELDAIFHQPGWTELPRPEFRRRVEVKIAADGWVVDGNYGAVRDLVWAAADTVVWIDLPRRVVIRRLIRRTIIRAVTRRELWNGNCEPLTGVFRRDPRENIVLWSWTNHHDYARRYEIAATEPANSHLTFIRVSSQSDADRLVAANATASRRP